MSERKEQNVAAETNVEQAIDDATQAVKVETRKLEELSADDAPAAAGAPDAMGLGSLLDVPVRVTVEVGRTKLTLGELVGVRPGSLLELDREAHEPADVLVNGKTVARGEIVTIDDRYGVRITEVT